MSYIIFFSGEVASLKSTLSKEVARELHTSYLATHTYGEVISKGRLSSLKKRNQRYERLFKDLDALLLQGKNVVIDGTFIRKNWRRQLYQICANHAPLELICFECKCSDRKVQKARLAKRKTLLNSPDHHCHRFEDVLHDKKLSQKFDSQDWAFIDSLLLFDSCSREFVFGFGEISLAFKHSLLRAIDRLETDKKYLKGFL